MTNVAADPKHAEARAALEALLKRDLAASGDPRETAGAMIEFDVYPYSGGAPKYPGMKKKKK